MTERDLIGSTLIKLRNRGYRIPTSGFQTIKDVISYYQREDALSHLTPESLAHLLVRTHKFRYRVDDSTDEDDVFRLRVQDEAQDEAQGISRIVEGPLTNDEYEFSKLISERLASLGFPYTEPSRVKYSYEPVAPESYLTIVRKLGLKPFRPLPFTQYSACSNWYIEGEKNGQPYIDWGDVGEDDHCFAREERDLLLETGINYYTQRPLSVEVLSSLRRDRRRADMDLRIRQRRDQRMERRGARGFAGDVNDYLQAQCTSPLNRFTSTSGLLTYLQRSDLPKSVSDLGYLSSPLFYQYLLQHVKHQACAFPRTLYLKIREFDVGITGLNDLPAFISQCRSRIIVIDVILVFSAGSGHSNLLLVDQDQKTYERFEPHGRFTDPFLSLVNPGKDNYHDLVDETLRGLAGDVPSLQGYSYVAPLDYCPLVGPQHYAQVDYEDELYESDEDPGYCVVFSLLYAHLRLLDPDISQQQTVISLLSYDPQELQRIMRRYLYQVEEIIPSKDDVSTTERLLELYQLTGFDPCSGQSATSTS
jgi:hypothetical protein